MPFDNKSFIGKGKITLNGRFIGNVSEYKYNITEDEKLLPDYTSTGGGNWNSLSRISAVGLSMIMHDYDKNNLAMLLYGSTTAAAAAAVVDEAQSSIATADDLLIPTDNIIDTGETVTVTGSGGTPTYTGYEVSAAGITITGGGDIASLADGTALEVSYTSLAVDVIQALTSTAQEYELVFDGVNEAQGGEVHVHTVHKAKFGATQELDAIGDDFAALPISGQALKDTTITTAGLSQYVEIKQAQ